ncbi:MAG: type II toxin-antitoxin system VapC family toxin [Desulfobacterales bacterium]
MGSKQELILIDTNIFVIDLRYKRDTSFKPNQSFLSVVAQNGCGFTTIVNLLELCGILSLNLNQDRLLDLWTYFQDRYKITVLPEPNLQNDFPSIEINRLFGILSKKSSFGDALMISVAEKYFPFVSTLVTWDDEHFRGKFPGNVLTPNAFLAGHN